MAEAVAVAPKPKRSAFKKFLWFGGTFLLAVAAAYGAGWWQTRSEIDALSTQVTQSQQAAGAAEQAIAAQRRLVSELEARRMIHLALIAFDANNFGTAQEQLRAAATELESASTTVDPGLAALASSLRAMELSPSLDIAAQRAAILQLATRFDNLRPPKVR